MIYKNVRFSFFLPVFLLFTVLSANSAPATLEQLRQWASHREWTRDLSDEELLKLSKAEFECFVISHTHWDKEWRFSIEQHNLRLVKLIDNTIDMLEKDPEFTRFVLDGQSSLIKDYLDTRPEMRERVENLVKTDRLLVGPLYTQTDFLVSSGEEIVRNLLLGIQTARDVGKSMMYGYTADNFGFCAQMPQIYQGFGIPYASMYRGTEPGAPEYKSVFEWEALDGTTVHVGNLTGPSAYLMFTWPYDVPELAEHYLMKSLHYIIPYAVNDKLLLMAGSDATEPNPDLPKVLERLHDEFPGLTFHIASHKEFVDAVLADNPDIPTLKGTLRHSAHSCTGAISGRLKLKRENAEAYTTIEHFAEPYSALAWMMCGRRYPHTSFEKAWAFLFENLSHDDMAGYCFDQAHEHNHVRYFESNRIAETLAIRGTKTIVEKIKTPDKYDFLHKPIVVFNSLAWDRTDAVEFWMPDQEFGIDPSLRSLEYKNFQVTDLEGNNLPTHVIAPGKSGHSQMFRIRFLAKDIPSFGYKTFLVNAVEDEANYDVHKDDVREIENEFLKIKFNDNGTFDLTDKESGIAYPGLHYFEDQTSRGGILTCSFNGEPSTSLEQRAEIELVEDNPMGKTVRVSLPDWLIPSNRKDGEMVPMPITSYITLITGVKRVDIYTEAENNASFHFLRAAFPVAVDVKTFMAGEQFGAQALPVYDHKNPPGGPWGHEVYPHLDWCDLTDGKIGLALFDRGTPNISVYPCEGGTRMLLPMFRSAGSPGADIRHSLPYPRFSTEDRSEGAQQFGTQRVYYSLYPHEGDWLSSQLFKHSLNKHSRLWPATLWKNDRAKWQAGPYGFEPYYQPPEGDLPPTQSLMDVTGSEGLVLSAFKKAEESDAIVVRFFNSTPNEGHFKISFFEPALDVKSVNMLEEEAENTTPINWKLTDSKQTEVEFDLRGFGIITLRMAVKAPEIGHWRQTVY